MDFVGVVPSAVAGVAGDLLAQAVALQAAIVAATPAMTTVVPPGAEEISATSAALFNANNAQNLGMAQAHVVELVSAAEAVGGSGIAFQVQDLVNKGLLFV
jgi:hypothetical protein